MPNSGKRKNKKGGKGKKTVEDTRPQDEKRHIQQDGESCRVNGIAVIDHRLADDDVPSGGEKKGKKDGKVINTGERKGVNSKQQKDGNDSQQDVSFAVNGIDFRESVIMAENESNFQKKTGKRNETVSNIAENPTYQEEGRHPQRKGVRGSALNGVLLPEHKVAAADSVFSDDKEEKTEKACKNTSEDSREQTRWRKSQQKDWSCAANGNTSMENVATPKGMSNVGKWKRTNIAEDQRYQEGREDTQQNGSSFSFSEMLKSGLTRQKVMDESVSNVVKRNEERNEKGIVEESRQQTKYGNPQQKDRSSAVNGITFMENTITEEMPKVSKKKGRGRGRGKVTEEVSKQQNKLRQIQDEAPTFPRREKVDTSVLNSEVVPRWPSDAHSTAIYTESDICSSITFMGKTITEDMSNVGKRKEANTAENKTHQEDSRQQTKWGNPQQKDWSSTVNGITFMENTATAEDMSNFGKKKGANKAENKTHQEDSRQQTKWENPQQKDWSSAVSGITIMENTATAEDISNFGKRKGANIAENKTHQEDSRQQTKWGSPQQKDWSSVLNGITSVENTITEEGMSKVSKMKGRGRGKVTEEVSKQQNKLRQIQNEVPTGRGRGKVIEEVSQQQNKLRQIQDEAPTCLPQRRKVDTSVLNSEVVPRWPLEARTTAIRTENVICSPVHSPKQSDPSNGKTEPFPKKPEPGRLGQKIQLIVNHFPFNFPRGFLYHYEVDIQIQLSSNQSKTKQNMRPNGKKNEKVVESKNKAINRKVIDTVFKARSELRKFWPAYDGRKNLITRRPLPIVPLNMTVTVNGDDGRENSCEVTIDEFKNETTSCAISLDELHEVFSGRNRNMSLSEIPAETIMALEIVLRHLPSLQYFNLGRSFFQQQNPVSLGEGLEMRFGHHQSIRLGQWKPMININITATAFYEKKNIVMFIADVLKTTLEHLQSVGLTKYQISHLSKELKNLKVEVTHLPYPRRYKVTQLTAQPANEVTFIMEQNGKKENCSVSNYFQQQYKLRLKYPHLPCLQTGSDKKKVYLPVEVCQIVENQHCKAKLSPNQTARMMKQTAIPPRNRFRKINQLRREIFNNNPWVNEFELKISDEPTTVDARVINTPMLQYLDQQVTPRHGSWNMIRKKFYSAAKIENWVLLSLAAPSECNKICLDNFADKICKEGRKTGMTLKSPSCTETYNINNNNIRNIVDILRKMKERHNPQLVVVVLPSGKNTLIYNEVKRIAETEQARLGLITQCFKSDNVVNNCKDQVIANLCLKLNAKMGGVNNTLYAKDVPAILRNRVIVMGADVNHAASVDAIKFSVAAVVGSMDVHHCRYAATVGVQKNEEESKKNVIEIIIELDKMVKKILLEFYRRNNNLKPEKIIFYRDGVSEGQFAQVQSHEVRQVRKACYEMSHDSDYQPEITFIIVQKRHHTRFYPSNENEGVGKGNNAPPGTVVDTTITHPLNFDFFLCSHASPLGTARSAHYTVIWDDNDFSADELQKLSYYLCHVFTRCTRSISIPVPVMYADLVAYRSRQHVLAQAATGTTRCDLSSIMDAAKVSDGIMNEMYFV